jgi:hypothetical protein
VAEVGPARVTTELLNVGTSLVQSRPAACGGVK